jgi:hypothetical protein
MSAWDDSKEYPDHGRAISRTDDRAASNQVDATATSVSSGNCT